MVVHGASILMTAVQRTATALRATPVPAIAVFVLCVSRAGLHDPLHFYPLALYTPFVALLSER